jgi:hypothetical protein
LLIVPCVVREPPESIIRLPPFICKFRKVSAPVTVTVPEGMNALELSSGKVPHPLPLPIQ